MNTHLFRNDEPAVYRIEVVGSLDEDWSDRLGGMSITSSREADQVPIVTLSGRLLDQAALFGVLNALYDMHLPLHSVECLSIEGNQEPKGA